MRVIIWNMSVCGSLIFFLYLLLYPVGKRFFSIGWRYNILKLSLLFFLVPFGELKYLLLFRIFQFIPESGFWMVPEYHEIDTRNYIFLTAKTLWISQNMKFLVAIILLIGMISFMIFCGQLSKYARLKKFCLGDVSECDSESWNRILANTSSQLGIKKKVFLFFSVHADSPLTVGVFAPKIIIPESLKEILEKDEKEYLVVHELEHIKNRDLAVRFLALLVMAVHWFNPICYFLFREICAVSEIYCDGCTLENMKGAERKKYSNLLINLSSESLKRSAEHYVVHLVNYNVKLIERRILEMKMASKRSHVVLAGLAGGLICIAGGIPILAYTSPSIYMLDEEARNTGLLSESEIVVYGEFDIQPLIDTVPYDYFWQGEDGTVMQLEYGQSAVSTASCPHSYISGTIVKHTRSSDQSCKISYTNGKKCRICGMIMEEKEINTVHYGVCSHE